jgi:hypothetical protein
MEGYGVGENVGVVVGTMVGIRVQGFSVGD